jgi:hypothetical protein
MKNTVQFPEMPIGRAAVIAAISLFIMAVIAPIANFMGIQDMIVSNDANATYSNLVSSQETFRLSIFLFFIVAILDIIIAWALFIFLRPVNKSIALLGGWFRFAYAVLLVVLLSFLLRVVQLTSGADYLSVFNTGLLETQVMINLKSFNMVWDIALAVFGFHLLTIGWLIFKAGYMKKILGILLMIASLGYIIDGIGKTISPDYSVNLIMFTFIGEVVLIFWLLIKGRKLTSEIN